MEDGQDHPRIRSQDEYGDSQGHQPDGFILPRSSPQKIQEKIEEVLLPEEHGLLFGDLQSAKMEVKEDHSDPHQDEAGKDSDDKQVASGQLESRRFRFRSGRPQMDITPLYSIWTIRKATTIKKRMRRGRSLSLFKTRPPMWAPIVVPTAMGPIKVKFNNPE